MTKLSLILLLTFSAIAQKKAITLETLNGAGRGGGRGGAGAGAPTWLPDGKTFVFRQGRSLMVYDPATKAARLLVDTTSIDAAAVNPPPEEGPTDWTNRRAHT